MTRDRKIVEERGIPEYNSLIIDLHYKSTDVGTINRNYPFS